MSNLEGILGSAARLIFQLSKIQMFLAHQRTQKSIEKSFCHFKKKVLIQKSNLIDTKQIIYQKQIYTNKNTKYGTSVTPNTCSRSLYTFKDGSKTNMHQIEWSKRLQMDDLYD